MKNLKVVGIMNGTSLDGADFVLADINTQTGSCKFLDMATSVFPKDLEANLTQAARGSADVRTLAKAHFDLGRFYAKELKKHKIKKHWKFQAVGAHGQTVFHESGSATLQIGEPSFLAAEMGVPVVADFRPADIALGGKGAPLATFFHYALAKPFLRKESIAFQNIGGIANVSFFSRGSGKVFSFDTGPGNMLMNLLVQKISKGRSSFDRDGKLSSKGVCDTTALNKALAHPFFSKKPPKSCGREEFGEAFLSSLGRALEKLSPEDRLATAAEITARSIADAYRRFLPTMPTRVFVCGGGAHNEHLMFRLRYHLPDTHIGTTEDLGWPVKAIEGGAFALMAALKISGKSAHLPLTTGARRPGLLGKLIEI